MWDGTNLFMAAGFGLSGLRLFRIDRTTGLAELHGPNINTPRGFYLGLTSLWSMDWVGEVSNQAPVWDDTITAYDLPVDAPVGSLVANLIASDIDADDLTYSVGTHTGIFAITTAATIFTIGAVTNGTTYTVDVIVSDGELTDTLTLTIRVASVSDAVLEWITSQTVYLLSASPSVGDPVFTLRANVVGESDTPTYALSGNDAVQFAIDSATGAVTIARGLFSGSTYFFVGEATNSGVTIYLSIQVVVSPDTTLPLGETDINRPQTPQVDGDFEPDSEAEGGSSVPVLVSDSEPQIDGFHEYRENFDILQANSTVLVGLNLEMIRDQVVESQFFPTAAQLDFGTGVVRFIPVYPIRTVYVGDWIIRHEGGATAVPERVPEIHVDDVLVVRGFETIGDDEKQVIIAAPPL